MKFNRFLLTLIVSIFAFALPNAAFAQILPTDVLQNGYAIFSCRADDDARDSIAVRKLGGIAGAYNNPNNLGDVDSSAQFQNMFTFTRGQFESNEILGITFDSRNGRIYAGSSQLVSGQTTLPGIPNTKVYTISPDGNTVELVATLPGSLGTGWIDIDEEHNQLYVSNMDDGQIYAIDLANGLNQTGPFTTYAPLGVVDPIDGIYPPEGQRIAGVGYNHVESRLYYSVWGQTARDKNLDNTLRSVAINPDGSFLGTSDVLEFTTPNQKLGLQNGTNAPESSAPIFDIDFDTTGSRLLIAERDFMTFTRSDGEQGVTLSAHAGRVIELNGNSGALVAEPIDKHVIGQLRFSGDFASQDTNSTGGVSFAPTDVSIDHFITGNDNFITALGEGLPLDNNVSPQLRIYGIQYHPITGGNQATSLKIDLDNDTNDIDKGIYFDIDVRSTPYDFGDLPDSFGTLATSNGAAHGITGSFLGTSVTQEVNGNPSALANGDSSDDGVVFLTPIVAGTTAKIQVTTSTSGFLNPFFDFNGDGILERPTIVSVNGFNGGTNGQISNTDIPLLAGMNMFLIQVPDNATGNVPSRFRFSATNPNGQLGSTGAWLDGEVEDYILSSISGRVFNDNDAQDGLDIGDPGVENFLVKLLDANGNAVLDADRNPITTLTDIDGNYSFSGLTAGEFRVQFMIMDSSVFTVENAGDDDSIQSNANTVTGLSGTFTLGTGQNVPNIDAGILTIEDFATLWNGFCDQGNFLTLSNNCDENVTVTLELLDRDGSSQSSQVVVLTANRSADIPIDLMPGFSFTSFGIIRAQATPRSCITGLMALWTPGLTPDDAGTVFQTDIVENSTGTTFAVFNTFNPSMNPEDADIATEHWLQLANLDTASPITFLIERFDNLGNLIETDNVTVGPLERNDIEAGHDDDTMNRYGIVRITPSDSTLEYRAQLFRYGRDTSTQAGERMISFSFAENASAGIATTQYLSVSNGANAVNWLELNNLTGGSEMVSVDIFSNTQGLVSSETFNLAGLNSLHVPATTGLGDGESGVAIVTPLGGANLIVKSTSYFFAEDGAISAAFSIDGAETLPAVASGGYNTFLEQFNWLRLFNTSSSDVTVTVRAFDTLGVTLLGTEVVTLGATNGTDLDINGLFSLLPDTVGQLEITSSAANAIVADVLRVRYLNNDFSTVAGAQSYAVN